MPDSYQPNNAVYSSYTPFRNYLGKMNLFRSLQAIWAHTVFQQFHRTLPRYITHYPVGYNNSYSKEDFLRFHIHLWELETLTKEVIINCSPYKDKSLENWNYLSKSANHLKKLENDIAGEYSSERNVLIELHRISHRQFPWQKLPNQDKMIRYWKIYQPLSSFFNQKYSLDFDIYLTISMMLFGFYTEKFALIYPPNIEVMRISQELFDQYLSFLSKSVQDLSQTMKSQNRMNHDYAYAYHDLTGFPLIKIGYNNQMFIVCPLPTLFLNRTTQGLFYDLINLPGFDNAYGLSFQNYIGEYIEASNIGFTLYPEEKYGPRRHRKDTVDWILCDQNNSALFIECKTKRLTSAAKTALNDLSALQNDLRKIAEAVVQVYESIFDYESNLYPQLRFDASRSVYIVIATLEEWYLFGDRTLTILKDEVTSIFEERGYDLAYLEKYPYLIASSENIEYLVTIFKTKNISEVIKPKLEDQERSTWDLGAYLLDTFQPELQTMSNPFDGSYNEFLDQTIEKMKTV